MKVLSSKIKFEEVPSKNTKLQSAVAKLFKLKLEKRYVMEAHIRLDFEDKLSINDDLVDNFGKEWYVVSRNKSTNEYFIKSGESIHECNNEYFLTNISVIE